MEGGIYCITNQVNGKRYIGRTVNFKRRFQQYEYDFRERRINHINDYLLRAMDKHGFDQFEFSVIEFCEKRSQPERELYWMHQYGTLDRDKGYNLRSDTDAGMSTHPDTSAKISARLSAEWASGARDGHGAKVAASWESRDRVAQSMLMTVTLTKWLYTVDGVAMMYNDLVANGLGNVLTKFARTKSDSVVFKGHRIERSKYDT